MTAAALLMLAAAVFLAWVGGPFGWTFAVIYGAAGVDLLWFAARLAYLRRQARLR